MFDSTKVSTYLSPPKTYLKLKIEAPKGYREQT